MMKAVGYAIRLSDCERLHPNPPEYSDLLMTCDLFQLPRHGEVLLEVRQRLGRPGLELCIVTGLGIPLE
jgi:hypothetical protein